MLHASKVFGFGKAPVVAPAPPPPSEASRTELRRVQDAGLCSPEAPNSPKYRSELRTLGARACIACNYTWSHRIPAALLSCKSAVSVLAHVPAFG